MTIKEVLELGNEESFTVQDVSFKMILVEGGTFYMGAERGERIIEEGSNWSKIRIDSTVQNYDEEADDNESPVHLEHLNDFYIGETQVTQELWQAVMGNNPSLFKGADRPVENVNCNDCKDFIARLNKMFPGKNFNLPKEAEWEYAARGGIKSKGYKYAGSDNIDEVAWYDDNSSMMETHPVKTKFPNELGIYDMSGNVAEWCRDRYDSYRSPFKKTKGFSGTKRVIRSGCYSKDCRVTARCGAPNIRDSGIGFRIVMHPNLTDF